MKCIANCGKSIQPARTESDYCYSCRPCSVCEGIGAKARSRDKSWPGHWCDRCVARFTRQGSPVVARAYGQDDSIERRFNLYAAEPDERGCRIWQGTCASGHMGYGAMRVDGKMRVAHRIAWELEYGAVPEGKILLHSCDVPQCVEVSHLRAGTHAENMRDCLERGRKQLGLTEEQVHKVRELWGLGVSITRLSRDFDVSRKTIEKAVKGIGAYGLIE